MNVLIIGFGSIGRRHAEVLADLESVDRIDVVSKHATDIEPNYSNLNEVEDIAGYDYFIISNESHKHFDTLNNLCSRVSEKKILVEKPLYEKNHRVFETSNQVYVGYNLRFHPILQYLKSKLESQNIRYVNILSGQYLPDWRPGQDYRTSYSADGAKGGGVLRDLSHELDYSFWLFGAFENIQYISARVSDLEISSDDIFTMIGTIKNRGLINLTVDYLSKEPVRRLLIHLDDETIEADLVSNSVNLHIYGKRSEEIGFEPIQRNFTYEKMHSAILNSNIKDVCTYHEGNEVVNFINEINFTEL